MKALLDSAGAGDHDRRQDVATFTSTEVLRVSLEENLAMIARHASRYLRRAGREVIYDAEHFFDGWKANPEYAAQDDPGGGRGRARRIVVLCDTNGGSMPEEVAAITTRGGRGASTCRSASTATTTATWRWPIRWPPSTPAPCRCRARSTASASAAATPI